VVANLVGPIVFVASAISGWLAKRRFRLLLWGSPAVIVAGVVLAAGIWQTQKPKAALIDRYRTAVHRAFNADDLATAELFVQKLLQLDDTNPEARYFAAIIARERGDEETAAEIVQELAPEVSAGYPPAHFWIASEMAEGKERWSNTELDRLTHHLETAATSSQLRVDARHMLGQVYAATGNLSKAIANFDSIIGERPELRLPVAHMLQLTGQSERALSELDKAIAHYQDLIESDPDNIIMRVALAKSLFLRGQFPRAVLVLRERFSDADGDRCRAELASLFALQSDRGPNTQDAEAMSQRIELLQRALECDPECEEALKRVAVLSGLEDERGTLAQSLLKDALAAGRAPATVHLILGTKASLEGDQKLAQTHLEQALRLNPRMPQVLNNLAWVLVQDAEPDLERARLLADTAVAIWPSHPEFRATRGQILVRQERWESALLDLEIALRDLGSRENLHLALAEVYDQLGDAEQAALHRRRAEEIEEIESRPADNADGRR
jgi:tetratricopeptide (TPR) repeat protein